MLFLYPFLKYHPQVPCNNVSNVSEHMKQLCLYQTEIAVTHEAKKNSKITMSYHILKSQHLFPLMTNFFVLRISFKI